MGMGQITANKRVRYYQIILELGTRGGKIGGPYRQNSRHRLQEGSRVAHFSKSGRHRYESAHKIDDKETGNIRYLITREQRKLDMDGVMGMGTDLHYHTIQHQNPFR